MENDKNTEITHLSKKIDTMIAEIDHKLETNEYLSEERKQCLAEQTIQIKNLEEEFLKTYKYNIYQRIANKIVHKQPLSAEEISIILKSANQDKVELEKEKDNQSSSSDNENKSESESDSGNDFFDGPWFRIENC